MELMAVVDIAENAPDAHICVYVDASYIMYGLRRRRTEQRSITRSSNRSLWLRLDRALALRKEKELRFRVAKCASHGKDRDQASEITWWNDQADKSAVSGSRQKLPYIDPWPEQDDDYGLAHQGRQIMGDPRKYIKKLNRARSAAFWAELSTDGRLPRVLNSGKVKMGLISTLRSPTAMARRGHLGLVQFAFGLQSGFLRSPSRSFMATKPRKGKKEIKLPDSNWNPKRNGKNVCPLCASARADNYHIYGHARLPLSSAYKPLWE